MQGFDLLRYFLVILTYCNAAKYLGLTKKKAKRLLLLLSKIT